MSEQLELFGPVAEVEPLSRIKRYAVMDARTCGWNYYSDRLCGEARAAYEAAFRAERARMLNANSPGASG